MKSQVSNFLDCYPEYDSKKVDSCQLGLTVSKFNSEDINEYNRHNFEINVLEEQKSLKDASVTTFVIEKPTPKPSSHDQSPQCSINSLESMISSLTIGFSDFSITDQNLDSTSKSITIDSNSNELDSNFVQKNTDIHIGPKSMTQDKELARSMQFIAKRSWKDTQMQQEDKIVRDKSSYQTQLPKQNLNKKILMKRLSKMKDGAAEANHDDYLPEQSWSCFNQITFAKELNVGGKYSAESPLGKNETFDDDKSSASTHFTCLSKCTLNKFEFVDMIQKPDGPLTNAENYQLWHTSSLLQLQKQLQL